LEKGRGREPGWRGATEGRLVSRSQNVKGSGKKRPNESATSRKRSGAGLLGSWKQIEKGKGVAVFGWKRQAQTIDWGLHLGELMEPEKRLGAEELRQEAKSGMNGP